MRKRAAAFVLLAACSSGHHAAHEPGGPGPHAVTVVSAILPAALDVTVANVYRPSGAGPFPVVFLLHGFTRTKEAFANDGIHLASWGFVTVAPDMPNVADPVGSALDLASFVAWAQGHPAELGSGADPSRIGVVGHSAGGLDATVASQSPTSFVVLVGLDPVDDTSAGVLAASQVALPTAYLLAEPSSCNASGNGVAIWDGIAGRPKERLKVTGATHCDFEDPTDSGCTDFCGGWDATRHARILRYATAWLLDRLAGDASFAPLTMNGAAMAADAGISAVSVAP